MHEGLVFGSHRNMDLSLLKKLGWIMELVRCPNFSFDRVSNGYKITMKELGFMENWQNE